MHRPSRQHQHLLTKIARKQERAKQQTRPTGKRHKQWTRWSTQYAPLVQQEGGEQAETSQE